MKTTAATTVQTVEAVAVAEAVVAAAQVVEVVVVADAAAVGAKINKMKIIILYLVSTIVSGIWLWNFHQTYNPIILKGPEFLKYYLMLLTGFYASFLIGKIIKIYHSKIALYFLLIFLLLGFIKLGIGIYLGKPIGYLIMIIILQVIAMLIITFNQFNKKLK